MIKREQLLCDKIEKITFGIQMVWKWVTHELTSFFFICIVSWRPYSIVWICVRHKKAGPWDIFLNKLCLCHFTIHQLIFWKCWHPLGLTWALFCCCLMENGIETQNHLESGHQGNFLMNKILTTVKSCVIGKTS